MTRARLLVDRLLVVASVFIFSACAGEGCSFLQPIPGGFDNADKTPRAIEAKVTDGGFSSLDAVTDDLIATLFPDGLDFDVPPQCGSTKVCCGVPQGYCQIGLDLAPRPFDAPRLTIDAVNVNGARIGVRLRTRMRTLSSFPVSQRGPLGGSIDCWLAVNSAWSGSSDLNIYFELDMVPDDLTGELRARVVRSQVWGLSGGDVSIQGEFLCRFANETDAANELMANFARELPGAIGGFLCAKCESDGDCSHGTCSGGVCRAPGSSQCVQRLGAEGRVDVAALLGDLIGRTPPKALDLYAGLGDASSAGGGFSVNVTSGLMPATPADTHQCVPALAPPAANVPDGGILSGQTHPETGEAYDIGVAIHADQINHAVWAAHQAGITCIDIGTAAVPLLNTGALAIFMPSLTELTDGEETPMKLAVRPQTSPSFRVGANTFTELPTGEAVIDDPLIDIRWNDLEIDLYAWSSFRYVRFMTLVADVGLGVGVDIDETGKIVPVLGDVGDALTNLRVKNSELLQETPQEIVEVFPAILSVALPGLGNQLGEGFEFPELGGLRISMPDRGITGLSDGDYLGLFLNLDPSQGLLGAQTAMAKKRVQAQATFSTASMEQGTVTLLLGADTSEKQLEWQVRADSGAWTPFSRAPVLNLRRHGFKLPGRHVVEVRARVVGKPDTLGEATQVEWFADASDAPVTRKEPTPTTPTPTPNTNADAEGGCQSGGGGGAWLLLLIVAGALAHRRRAGIVLAAALSVFGCKDNTSSTETGPVPDPSVSVGRWASVAANSNRAVAFAYEAAFGDLVFTELNQAGPLSFGIVVDGAPAPSTPSRAYRNGSTAPGTDVGAWTSANIANDRVMVAYQDRDRGALKMALEIEPGQFVSHDVHQPDADTSSGAFASLASSSDGMPSVAYVWRGQETAATDETPATVTTQLTWARAVTALPRNASDWTFEVVDEATLEIPAVKEMPAGTGLFANNTFYSDNTPVLSYYHQGTRSLTVATRADDGWHKTVVAGAEGRDVGRWSSIQIDSNDTMHIAYTDADTGRLLYRTYSRDGVLGRVEVVDNGFRPGDRPHRVGGSAELVLRDGRVGIAYQDETAADVLWAERGDTGWTRRALFSGPAGYGFAISAAVAGDSVWVGANIHDPSRRPFRRTEVVRVE